MQIKKLNETDNSLLSRKEIKFEVDFTDSAVPSKNSIKDEVAKKYNTQPELVAINKIKTNFGSQKALVIIHIYKDEKSLKFLEPPKGKKSEPKKKAAGK